MCVTMSCRWESSKRPLFVKSVWLDGYRHAILSNEDPILKKNIKSPRSPSLLNSDNRERPKSKRNTEQPLTIPTVQLLLENVQRLKQESDKINKRPTKEKLQKSMTFDIIMKNEMNKVSKMYEVNLEDEKTLYSSFSCEKGFNSERFEQSSNSLTERVLLWLDLAGKYNKNQQENTFRSRNVRRNINKRISTAHTKDNFDVMHNDYVRNTTENLFNLQFYENVNESFNDYRMYKESSDNEMESHLTITELMDEEDDYREVNIEPMKNKTEVNKSSTPNVSKRQMHIFIPNIINKISDSNIINESNNYLLNLEVI